MKTLLGPSLFLLVVVVVLVFTFDSTTIFSALMDFRTISVFQNSKAFIIKPGGLSLHRP